MLLDRNWESWRSIVWMSGSFTWGIPELQRPQGKRLRRTGRPGEETILSTESVTDHPSPIPLLCISVCWGCRLLAGVRDVGVGDHLVVSALRISPDGRWTAGKITETSFSFVIMGVFGGTRASEEISREVWYSAGGLGCHWMCYQCFTWRPVFILVRVMRFKTRL